MGLWDKVKDAASKAADAAKEQVQREDSLLNKTVDATKRAADKAVVVAKDQVNRQDSALNKARAGVAAGTDGVLGSIDAMDAGARNDEIADARRYAARRKAETLAGIEEPPPEARPPDEIENRFPNSMEWDDEQVYKKVSETIYPEFRTLPSGDKKWALCEIARYDKKIVDLMRAIGSAYIDTVRQLADGDDGYQAMLDAAGLKQDRELAQAFRNWLDDTYDDEFYADDDGGHAKSVRFIGWLVFSRIASDALEQCFGDAGVRDVYGIARKLAKARALIDARDAVVERAFRPRRASFASQFLVQRGINADVHFAWLDSDGATAASDDEDDGDGGGSGGGGDDDSPFEI